MKWNRARSTQWQCRHSWYRIREFIDSAAVCYHHGQDNASLAQGRLPSNTRAARHSDTKVGNAWSGRSRHVKLSTLSFMSNLVERVVISRLKDYLISNDLFPRHQSAHRKKHSTETATLRVWQNFHVDVLLVFLVALVCFYYVFYCWCVVCRWNFSTWRCHSTGCHATTGCCRWRCLNTSASSSRPSYWTT